MAKIGHAARLLQAGALVAFPTETVYGLGADARNMEALVRLTAVKGRREGKPYSLMVPSLRHAEAAAGGFPRIARKLARLYWPGPLTIVVPRRGGGTVGLRLPEHPVARALLAHCGFPLATPSANRSGMPEPVSAAQVREALDGEIALILDGGPARQGRPSAVVRVLNETLQIQREGLITNAELLEAASPTVLFVCSGNTCRSPMAAGFCQLGMAEAHKPPTSAYAGGEGLPFRVLSAGTSVIGQRGADKLAIEAMREVGVDISGHRTRPLTPVLVDRADWIFAMTRAQRDSIVALMPTSAERVQLLSSRNEDISDPAAGSLELYRRVRDRVASCLRDVVRLVGGT
ncbi:MAG: L-threonylcarbamoyladenylate synthase [Planctomycetota bacterium]|nr:L-threonylcarbamoyladenylate synthase [Planctomycetota bacterium]